MMRIYDISMPVTEASTVWPGDPKVTIRQVSSLEMGDESNVSQMRMSVHTGTHIDAPRHFLRDGKTIGEIPLNKLIGKAVVIEIDENVDVITQAVLEVHPQLPALESISKVLIKTRNSKGLDQLAGKFNKDYVALDASGAQFLTRFKLDLVGVDYFSIATFEDTDVPHMVLLQKEIILLEGINLVDVPAGIYDLYCLPINLAECEGAPARVILVSEMGE